MKQLMMIALFLAFNFVNQNSLEAQCNSGNTNGKAVKTNYHENGNDVVDIAIGSPDHTTLVAAVKAAGLVETLKGKGPFTIFAPTNTAFAKLPTGTVENLLQAKNKSTLGTILTYHVVAGNFSAKEVIGAIQANGGQATFTTVSGDQLKAGISNGVVILEDENGGRAAVTTVDLMGSNGVIHVIDSVVLPK